MRLLLSLYRCRAGKRDRKDGFFPFQHIIWASIRQGGSEQCGEHLAHPLHAVQEEAHAVVDEDHAADHIDDFQQLGADVGAEEGDDQGDAEEPQEGSAGGAQDELKTLPRRHAAGPEAAEDHGAVQDGLGVEPGDHAGLHRHLLQGQIDLHGLVQGGLLLDEAHADADDDDAAAQQQEELEEGEALHHRADAEEAEEGQGDVEKDDDEGGEESTVPGLGEGGVDDEEVLHPDGCHVGQADGQTLKIGGHGRAPFLLAFLGKAGIMVSEAGGTSGALTTSIIPHRIERARTKNRLTRSGGAYHGTAP